MRKLYTIPFMFIIVIIMGFLYAGCGNGDAVPTPHGLQHPPPTQDEPQEVQTHPQPQAGGEDCLEKGEQLFGQKNYSQAIMVLRNCESSPEALELLGISYYELNYIEEAKEYLQRAIKSSPDNVELQIRYASAFALGREFRRSVEEFQKLVEKYPSNNEVRAGFARSLGWNRNYNEAIAEYKRLIEQDSEDYESWVQIGLLTSWNKRFNDAVVIFGNIIASQPPEQHELDARLHLAEVLSWMKRFDESIAEYDRAIALAPKDARGYLGKGQVEEWQGRYKAAIRTYEQAVQADPGNKNAQARLQQLMWVR